MSRAVGVKKPQEAQKAKALWAMKAAKDRKEEFKYLACEEDNSRRNKTRLEFFLERTSPGFDCCVGQSMKIKLARGLVEARQQ